MGKFSKLNLEQWFEEDLEDLEEDFNISEKSIKELNDLIDELNRKAFALNEAANELDNKSAILKRYLNIIGK